MMTESPWRGGVLLVDKPSGPSSFDIVRAVRRQLGIKKVGHTGTLDPLAGGLLVVCVGEATRIVPFLTAVDKRYIASIQLGLISDTYDSEGACRRVMDIESINGLSTSKVETALDDFRGEIKQQPPSFSAIKIDGERAYTKARRGEQVEMPTRTVRIHRCELLGRDCDTITLDIECSKGTYIRSIAHDLGQLLHTGAVLTGLRRMSVGALPVDEAIPLDEFLALSQDEARGRCVAIGDALPNWPRVQLDERQTRRIQNGQTLEWSDLPNESFLAYNPQNRLIALMQASSDNGETKILRGFPTV